MTEQAWEHEVESLTKILRITESPEQFCIATELVNRNRITNKPKRILKESAHYRLREFRFLINKN
jgi:hypothetical protein